MDDFTSTASATNQETITDINTDFSSETNSFDTNDGLPLPDELNYDYISNVEENSQVVIDEVEITEGQEDQQFADWESTVSDDSSGTDSISGESITNEERESIRSTENPGNNAFTLPIPIQQQSGDAQAGDSGTESDTESGGSERGESAIYYLSGVEEEENYQQILESINQNLDLIYQKINNEDLETLKSEFEEYVTYKVEEDKVHTYYMQTTTGLIGMILGGIIVYAFIGRIR